MLNQECATPAGFRPNAAAHLRSRPTIAQSAHPAMYLHPIAGGPAAEWNILQLRLIHRAKVPPEQTTAAHSAAGRLRRDASPQTLLRRQTQRRNRARPRDILPAGQTFPYANHAGAVAPCRPPPEKHPAATSTVTLYGQQLGRTARP